tara:strand:- start:272 stop:1219 length:948 start_codon:yes stop_codon:yes gene_type:complete
MGVIKSSPGPYYQDDGLNGDQTYGHYRYIPLNEIIDSFNATYVGKDKLCENVQLNDINFHAIRALQELSYDTLRSTKDWEVEVPSTLVLVMPLDYVNYIKVAWSDGNGIERILYPARKTSNAFNVNQGVEPSGGFETGGDAVDLIRTAADGDANHISDTAANFKSNTASDIGSMDADNINDNYDNTYGQRYGIDPQHAQANGSFFIDEDKGKFHFSSNVAGKTLVLRYLSDGVSSTAASGIDLTTSLVPKLAEEAIYKHILYGVLAARTNTSPNLLMMIKKERFAETRKAKIRLSNLKSEELTQMLRGSSKHIKH